MAGRPAPCGDSSLTVRRLVAPEPRLLFTTNGRNRSAPRNNFAASDLVSCQSKATDIDGTPMTATANQISEEIDGPTSRSICRAIGERLRQNLRPQDSELPSSLRRLMDELRRQERRN